MTNKLFQATALVVCIEAGALQLFQGNRLLWILMTALAVLNAIALITPTKPNND